MHKKIYYRTVKVHVRICVGNQWSSAVDAVICLELLLKYNGFVMWMMHMKKKKKQRSKL